MLKPGGELHVGDYTRPADPVQALCSWRVRLCDGRERTRENFTGRFPEAVGAAGFTEVR